MKYLILSFFAFLIGGCVYPNSCGVSTSYYNDCVEYYDVMGIYHKDCSLNNIINICDQKEKKIEDCLNCN